MDKKLSTISFSAIAHITVYVRFILYIALFLILIILYFRIYSISYMLN